MTELEQKSVSETVVEKSENLAQTDSEFDDNDSGSLQPIPSWLKAISHLRQICVFLQILAFLVGYAVLSPIYRNRDLVTSTTWNYAIFLVLSMFLSVLLGFATEAFSRTKLVSAIIVSSILAILSVLTVIVLTLFIRNRGEVDSNGFQDLFFGILQRGGHEMKTLHKFQQSSECCGIRLPSTVNWRQSPFSSPWSSWYYRTMLSEDYAEEARRLFTLPWSCCSWSTAECEHLAFERVSVSAADKYLVEEELIGLERKLKKKLSQSARDSVFDRACELSSTDFLEPVRIMIVSGVFVISSFIIILSDGISKVNMKRSVK